jgi:hypothetical protein
MLLSVMSLISVATAAWQVWPRPSEWEAAALLLVRSKQRTTWALRDTHIAHIALVKSPRVLNAALRSPQVANIALLREVPDPISWLEENLKVSFDIGPEVLRIALRSSRRRDDLAVVVDAVASAYLEVANVGTNKLDGPNITMFEEAVLREIKGRSVVRQIRGEVRKHSSDK